MNKDTIEIEGYVEASRVLHGKVKFEVSMDDVVSLVKDLSPLDSFVLLHTLAGKLTVEHLEKLRSLTPEGFDKITSKMEEIAGKMRKITGHTVAT